MKFKGQSEPLFMLAAHAPARQGSCRTMNFIILKIKKDSGKNSWKPSEKTKGKAQDEKCPTVYAQVITLACQASTGYYSLDMKNIGVQGAQESFKYLL